MLKRVSEFIVDRRVVFFALFAVLVVYSALSIGRVSVNSDLTASLPADTPTRQGLTIMEDEFNDIQGEVRPALIDALERSIVEISSSSLTTISGLVALTLIGIVVYSDFLPFAHA